MRGLQEADPCLPWKAEGLLQALSHLQESEEKSLLFDKQE